MSEMIFLFPAPAGMIPLQGKRLAELEAFPRTRGDDPSELAEPWYEADFSPHPRG